MNSIDRLISNYERQVRLQWADNLAGKQRVWFAVYPPADERRVRARMPSFEEITLAANHGWASVDLAHLLPTWLAAHKYRENVFKEPRFLKTGKELEIRAAALINDACSQDGVDSNTVVAVVGLASLFDFMKVSELVDRVEDSVKGRLLVFFPGEYQRNIYRFMDARDGFNYMAIPITSTENFINS